MSMQRNGSRKRTRANFTTAATVEDKDTPASKRSRDAAIQLLLESRSAVTSHVPELKYTCLSYPVLPELSKIAPGSIRALSLKLEVGKIYDTVESLALLCRFADSLETLELCFQEEFFDYKRYFLDIRKSVPMDPQMKFDHYQLDDKPISWMSCTFPRLKSLAISSINSPAFSWRQDSVPESFWNALIDMMHAKRLPTLQHFGLCAYILENDSQYVDRLWRALPADQLVSIRLSGRNETMDDKDYHDLHERPGRLTPRVFPHCRYLVTGLLLAIDVTSHYFPSLEVFHGHLASGELSSRMKWLRLSNKQSLRTILSQGSWPVGLEQLEVSYCDEEIARHIGAHFPYLQELTVRGQPYLRQEWIEPLVDRTRLESIELWSDPRTSAFWRLKSTGTLRRIGVRQSVLDELGRDGITEWKEYTGNRLDLYACASPSEKSRSWTVEHNVSLWTPCISCFDTSNSNKSSNGAPKQKSYRFEQGDEVRERELYHRVYRKWKVEHPDVPEDSDGDEDEDEDEDEGTAYSGARQSQSSRSPTVVSDSPVEKVQRTLRQFLRDKAWVSSTAMSQLRLRFYRQFSLWISYDKCGHGPLDPGGKARVMKVLASTSLLSKWQQIVKEIESLFPGTTDSNICGQLASVINTEKDTW